MFKKLRNKIIITNVLITSAILVIALSSIYVFSNAPRREKPLPPIEFQQSPEMSLVFEQEIERERDTHKDRLAGTC